MLKLKHLLVGSFAIALFATVGCIPENPNAGISGCTESSAINFNPYASTDDGSCVYVERKQRAGFFDFTATWCGPCGNWGMPDFNAEITTRGDDVVAMGIHASGSDYELSESVQLNSDKGITGIPSLREMSKDGFAAGGAYAGAIDATLAGTAKINTYVNATIQGDKVIIETQSFVFEDIPEELQLGIVIVENGVIGYQNGAPDPPNTEHNHLPRAFVNGAYGTALGSGLAANDIIEKTFEVAKDPGWNPDKLEAYAYIWYKDGTDWWVMNADHGEVH